MFTCAKWFLCLLSVCTHLEGSGLLQERVETLLLFVQAAGP